MEINIRDGYRNHHKYEEVQCANVVMRGIIKATGWFPGRKALLFDIDGVEYPIRPNIAGTFFQWEPTFRFSFPEGEIEIRQSFLGRRIRIDCPQLDAHLVLQCPNDFFGRREHKEVQLFKDNQPAIYSIRKSKEIVEGKGRRSNLPEEEEAEEELVGIEYEPFRRGRFFTFTTGIELAGHDSTLRTTLKMFTFYQLYMNNLVNKLDSPGALRLFFP